MDSAYVQALAHLGDVIRVLLMQPEVKEVSAYLLSGYNLKRPKEELEALCAGFEAFRDTVIPALLRVAPLSFSVVGDTASIEDERLREVSRSLELNVEGERRINLLIGYTAEWEMEEAPTRLSCGSSILDGLAVRTPVDVVIRTGGARTLSDFLPLQCGYAQLVFRDELWNDFGEDVLVSVVDRLRSLKPRYGE